MYNWSIMGLSDLVIEQSVSDLSVQIFCSDSPLRYILVSVLEETVLRKLSRCSRMTPSDHQASRSDGSASQLFSFSGSRRFSTCWQRVRLRLKISPSAPLTRMKAECPFQTNAMISSADSTNLPGMRVTQFTNYSHVSSVIPDDLLAIAVWKDVTMLLTCSCRDFSFFFSWCFSMKEKQRHQKLQHLVIIHIYRLLKQLEFRFACLYGQNTPNVSIFDWQISTSSTKHRIFHCMFSPQHLGSCFCCESHKYYLSFLHFVSSICE